jgi:AraC-like DNA-binding protein
MLTLKTHHPRVLYPYVKSFWRLEVASDLSGPYEEDIIPDGHHEIIFQLRSGNAWRKSDGRQCEGDWQCEPAAFFAGQTLQSYRLRLMPGTITYGIRFYPHTLALMFGFPADRITDRLCPLDDPRADELYRCIDPNPERTFARWEQWLAARIGALQLTPGFQYTAASVATILQHKGNIRISGLMRLTGVSARHLDSLFDKYVGVTPKVLAIIVKFNYFLQYRNGHPGKSLTECVYEANFYDQSHLIKLFRSFTGKAPAAWFREQNYISDRFASL